MSLPNRPRIRSRSTATKVVPRQVQDQQQDADPIFQELLARTKQGSRERRRWQTQLLADYCAAAAQVGEDPTGMKRVISYCFGALHVLNGRERKFVDAMTKVKYEPTPKQRKWLVDIFWRLQG
jgi:hypothetical protein